jgi:hypothetical protein
VVRYRHLSVALGVDIESANKERACSVEKLGWGSLGPKIEPYPSSGKAQSKLETAD